MTMEPKTLANILDEAVAYHKRLVAHLRHCQGKATGERQKMLLDFIADHEEWMCTSLNGLESVQDKASLETWFYEYTDRNAILFSRPEEIPFHTMSYDEISEQILEINEQLVDLFRYLKGRSETKASEEATGELLHHMATNTKSLSKKIADTEGL